MKKRKTLWAQSDIAFDNWMHKRERDAGMPSLRSVFSAAWQAGYKTGVRRKLRPK